MPSSSRPPGILFFSINGNGLGQRAALGLERDGRCVLLSPGPGNVKDVSGIGPELIAELREHRYTVVGTRAPISMRDLPPAALAAERPQRPTAADLSGANRAGLRRLGLLPPLVVEPWLPGWRWSIILRSCAAGCWKRAGPHARSGGLSVRPCSAARAFPRTRSPA